MLFITPLVISAMPKVKEDSFLIKKLKSVPDSLFTDVKQEDLLADDVYIKLARDGWSQEEIQPIMDDYMLKNRSKVRGSLAYGRYAKQWLPSLGFTPGGDTLYQYVDTTYNENMMRMVRQAAGADFDTYYFSDPYTPEDRKKGIRQPGIFRHVHHKPSSGRIHWIHVHPENDDSLMVIPDGAGIFRTHDLGKTWECITDRIPVREHRNVAQGYSIPVDPDDWNHIFAFMSNGNPVYETRDGGLNWRRIEGASSKNFKRGYCFRDRGGKLKFIGVVPHNGWNSQLWFSEDTCKTWTQIVIPEDLKEVNPHDTKKGAWLQQIEFDPSDRNMIYLPSSRGIYYFDDGIQPYEENGMKKFRLKRMRLQVKDADGIALRSDTTVFPLKANSPAYLNIDPNNPRKMWFACATRQNYTGAIYYTEDKGVTWRTIHEPSTGVGDGRTFGNEAPGGWLGGFGVNYRDPKWVYGCSMSSAVSSTGGRSFWEYSWPTRIKSLQEDGQYYPVTNARHNADNHCIVSHKSGRVFRGSDAGLLMRDLDINGNEWVNVGNQMGQMLYYGVKVNEFGDQLILGNTQDLDAQTYRYGRWGAWRGYEGSTAFVNPYANMGYYSGGGNGLEDVYFGSWQPGYAFADVCTGKWYLRRTDGDWKTSFARIDDVGRSVTYIPETINTRVRYSALARDKGHATLFVLGDNKCVFRSEDNGKTFTTVIRNTTASTIAADPDNSDILYLGEQGQVIKYNFKDDSRTTIGEGLPKISPNELFFHEGSGDLYFINYGSGIFIKEKDASHWRIWMKGYNPSDAKNVVINYTTQEMVLADYGRGVYVADLQNPSDRYFKEGFGLKELSQINGRRTIGIDTDWTIPLYYYYEWTVNGKRQSNPYQYLTDSLSVGDQVQLKLTLRESPDVSTTSEVFVVAETANCVLEKKTGKAVAATQSGMLDLGYVDYFFNDFTIDFWVKPKSEGVIIGNRQKDFERGAKGWFLAIEKGALQFCYAPANRFDLPTYEPGFTQQAQLNGGLITMNKWIHITIAHEREGKIRLYVDGKKTAESDRILPKHTLNNAMNLTLFADGFDRRAMEGAIDELKIWDYALTDPEIRHIMFSHEADKKSGLVYYNGFNKDSLNQNADLFTGKQPQIRKRAEISFVDMPIAVCADQVITRSLSGQTDFDAQKRSFIRIIAQDSTFQPELTLYVHQAEDLAQTAINLDKAYYDIMEYAYQIRCFTDNKTMMDTVSLEFSLPALMASKQCRLYMSDLNAERKYWRQYRELEYNSTSGKFVAQKVRISELQDKMLIAVALKPSIEMMLKGISSEGSFTIYQGKPHSIPFNARIVGELEEPFTSYAIQTNSEALKSVDALYFTKGNASGNLWVTPDSLGAFGDITTVELRGEDKRMMPFPINLENRVLQNRAGSSILAEKGGLVLGDGSTFESIRQTNTLSMMGWVRIDSAAVLSGMKPLIFFRGGSPSVATGLNLENGNLRCHWNEENWSWSTRTPHNITSQDLGRWVHVALIARPTGIDYYLNGMKFTSTRNLNKTRINSALLLGQNREGETWFSGAFDHVGLWNRSLTQDEVIHYMHNTPALNDSALVAYLTMDYLSKTDNVREVKTGKVSYKTGKVTTNHRSPVPFVGVPDQKWQVHLPQGSNAVCYVNRFNSYPYNYTQSSRSLEKPLKKQFYTVSYTVQPAFGTNDSIELTYKDESIVENEHLVLAIRKLGSESPFSHYVKGVALKKGEISFKVSADQMGTSSELMLFLSPDSDTRPVKGSLFLMDSERLDNKVILDNYTDCIYVGLNLSNYSEQDTLILSVKNTEYASVEKDTIHSFREGERYAIRINKAMLSKKSWNPLTVSILGAEVAPLTLQVALEPRVVLRLKNGDSDYALTTNNAITTLEVEAELIEGILEEKVQLETTSDMDHSLNTGNGTLLADRVVTVGDLSHTQSSSGDRHEGWNLIGNPYLANINLTKKQNVQFDPAELTKFVYLYNSVTGNYEASDMTQFDQNHQIKPFQAYFVQALQDKAKLHITPVAKETKSNRRTLDHFTATERMFIRLQLHSDGKMADRTDVILEEQGNKDFVINEDASKLWSLNANVNQLYTLAGQTAVSINTLPVENMEIPLLVKVGTGGTLSFKVEAISEFAFGEVLLKDTKNKTEWVLSRDTEFSFEAVKGEDYTNRFVLCINRVETNLETVRSYSIFIQENICHISGLQGDAHILIFDMQGRIHLNDKAYASTYEVSLPSDNYLVKIKENGKEFVSKIVVR